MNHPNPQKLYADEFAIAMMALIPYGGQLAWSKVKDEAFTYKSPYVSLVFYPHRTSAGNYHLRVRDNGSKNKKLTNSLMKRLDEAAGNNCTFTRKQKGG